MSRSEVATVPEGKGKTHTSNRRLALFTYGSEGSGIVRVMVTLAQGFADRGLCVDFVVPNARHHLLRELPSNVRLVELGARRLLTSMVPLARYIRGEKPDLILSALPPGSNCIVVCAWVMACTPLRLILVEHSNVSSEMTAASGLRKKLPILMRWAYSRASGIVAVSGGVADDLALSTGLSRKNIEVIDNPVATTDMLAKSHEPIQHPWFRPGEAPVILGVGRLSPQKDFPTLIRAFAKLRKSRAARLMILGDGPDRSKLEQLVESLGLKDDVFIPGFLPNPYPYIRAASLFVLSSRWEGLPTVLIEALACSTPVVSTDCPSGPVEILESGRLGRLVPVGNDRTLADAMDVELEVDDGRDYSSHIWNRFSKEASTKRYLDVLNRIMSDA